MSNFWGSVQSRGDSVLFGRRLSMLNRMHLATVSNVRTVAGALVLVLLCVLGRLVVMRGRLFPPGRSNLVVMGNGVIGHKDLLLGEANCARLRCRWAAPLLGRWVSEA